MLVGMLVALCSSGALLAQDTSRDHFLALVIMVTFGAICFSAGSRIRRKFIAERQRIPTATIVDKDHA